MEPHKLKRWIRASAPRIVFYTCGRPGRSKKDAKADVSDECIHAWVEGLPACSNIRIIEHPTTDTKPVPNDVLESVCLEVATLVREGRTVVVMDSGGESRVGQICRYIGAIEDRNRIGRP